MKSVAMMFYLALCYSHWKQKMFEEGLSKTEMDNIEKQKHLCTNEMKKEIENFERIKIKSTGVDEWFANRFETRFKKFQ